MATLELPILQEGNSGEAVRFLEQLLSSLHLFSPELVSTQVTFDAKYDSQAAQIIREFQAQYNSLMKADPKLREDGIVDRETWRALGDAIDFHLQESNWKILADKLISYFEYSTTVLQYGAVKYLNDDRGLTCGRNGFTTGTGDALEVIERYKQKKPLNNNLAKYIPELQRLNQKFKENNYKPNKETDYICNLVANFTTDKDKDHTTDKDKDQEILCPNGDGNENLKFDEDWKNAAKEYPAFKEAQDEIVIEKQYDPSQKLADDYGLELPLSRVVLYDTMVQHGDSGIKKLLEETGRLEGQKEEDWLKSFLRNRRITLLAKENNQDQGLVSADTVTWAKSVGRCDALLRIGEEEGNYEFNGTIKFKMIYPIVVDENNDNKVEVETINHNGKLIEVIKIIDDTEPTAVSFDRETDFP